LYELTGLFPDLQVILAPVLNAFPHIIPGFLDQSMRVLEDDVYVDRSYKVLNLGPANHISAYSAEIGFPVARGAYLEAVRIVLESARLSREAGEQYHTSPISLRFVKASTQYLHAAGRRYMHDRDSHGQRDRRRDGDPGAA